jgi:RNA polymerase sigma factor (sigma-70 family)
VSEGHCEWLARQFEAHRSHLRAVAYRMLGASAEADDAVQEAWLRLSRSGGEGIENLGGWLTTVVARVCLDTLRSRQARREESLDDDQAPLPVVDRHRAPGRDPEQEAIMVNSVSLALLVVLDRLEPAERLAFVMHDMFDVPFDEIASMLGRTEVATRKLASRARQRVRSVSAVPSADLSQQRETVEAFLAAMRAGDFDALLRVLDPDVVVRLEEGAGRPGTPSREIHGAVNWARGAITFSQFAEFITPAVIDGAVGLVFAPGGHLSRALVFQFANGKISRADVIVNPARLRELDLAVLE